MLLTIHDLRRASRRRLPRAVFDFIDGGAEDEVTMRLNRRAFEQLALVPRVLVDVHEVDLTTTVLARRIAAPLILAPTGLCGMATSRGEIRAARAAVEAEITFTASCMSSVTLGRSRARRRARTGSSCTSGAIAPSRAMWSSARHPPGTERWS